MNVPFHDDYTILIDELNFFETRILVSLDHGSRSRQGKAPSEVTEFTSSN